ncbi:hypothetical protein [Streptomyces sp. MBT62]|uniref:hypothetical protein n=1 Tax=Streptomyces sp. MBT62 TaxID=2800410 RepID=UPI00190A8E82|nr:hypothetical protein [Streptomyces sp. MBT62]MBK3571049.1 hypothetical protein [Streptomyces sp. MBT62]
MALVALWLVDRWAGLVFTLLFPLTALVARKFITKASDAEARYLAAQTGARTIRTHRHRHPRRGHRTPRPRYGFSIWTARQVV